jgi:membrane dipeptidase
MIDPHSGLLLLDSHVDIPWPPGPSGLVDGPRCVDLPKMRQGGVAATCFVAYIPQGPRTPEAHEAATARAHAMLDDIAAMATPGGGRLTPLVDEIEAAYAARVPAIVPVIENGHAVGTDLNNLNAFAAKGVRYITLTHNGHNAIADAAIPLGNLGDPPSLYGGLSDFGQDVVARMNDLGILVDISHTAKTTMLQAVERSRVPVVASHSCVRTLCDHKRNLDDEQLDALGASGGVIQITIVSSFLRAKARTNDASVADIADHVDYVVKRLGINHVGIGTDFDGGGEVRDFRTIAQARNLTTELMRRGYGHEELAKIWGGNFLRVLRQAEAARVPQ